MYYPMVVSLQEEGEKRGPRYFPEAPRGFYRIPRSFFLAGVLVAKRGFDREPIVLANGKTKKRSLCYFPQRTMHEQLLNLGQ